jgi:hypothetical protein
MSLMTWENVKSSGLQWKRTLEISNRKEVQSTNMLKRTLLNSNLKPEQLLPLLPPSASTLNLLSTTRSSFALARSVPHLRIRTRQQLLLKRPQRPRNTLPQRFNR